MRLSLADWLVIAAYFSFTLIQGLYFRRRSGRSTADYFVSGRRAAWWLIGTSMVATTFAADTPLVVTGLVYRNGIAGNWIWWSMLPAGMMTVFLFARLWVRAGLLTDVEFAEVRYAGKPAAFLRGFRAMYLGLLVNCVILGWVTKAMTTIVSVVLGVNERTALALVRVRPDSLHRHLRFPGRLVGRAVDGPVPVCAEDGSGDCGGMVWSRRSRRNAPTASRASPRCRSAAGPRRREHHFLFPGFFARAYRAKRCGQFR